MGDQVLISGVCSPKTQHNFHMFYVTVIDHENFHENCSPFFDETALSCVRETIGLLGVEDSNLLCI